MKLALNITFVGMVVVFIILILLSLVISLFSRILNTGKTNREDRMHTDNNDTSVREVNEIIEAESIARTRSDDDSELIAVLTAAVLAAMGGSSESSIRVKSYRHIPQTSPVWNVISRKEQIATKR